MTITIRPTFSSTTQEPWRIHRLEETQKIAGEILDALSSRPRWRRNWPGAIIGMHDDNGELHVSFACGFVEYLFEPAILLAWNAVREMNCVACQGLGR